MTSQIQPNNIDPTYPIAGQDNSVAGFHDNFGWTRTNFQYAADEITALQGNSVFTGSGVVNDLNNATLYDARIQDFTTPKVALGSVSGTVTLNYKSSHFQTLSTSGSVVLEFSGSSLPISSLYGVMQLQINVTSTSHTVTLPSEVDLNYVGIQGINSSTKVITFASTGTYVFNFSISDQGGTVSISEVNKRLQPFNNSSEDLATATGANLAVTTSYFSTATAETATLAAGVEGQIKVFAMYADSGDMVITVTNAGWKSSGTGTITFDTIGDACTLQYINSKWFCIGNNGAAFA